ncbi:MAG: alanine--tRNA ligase [Epulopiscium sp.]|jgi:alanyl-tRNA synthetase|nr:alanine--tRNA ligase [Candidatus Epulonipiscium sp.]HOQ16426.1 alanine--tRNA ligase [Defluviitaleaceae bacterium]HPT75522.1 alanine--tRNA ligase [Defluviitaleaceae bacterium]
MKFLGVNEIREKFLSFFESKDHLRMESFSLIPQNDKSLLLINAGMAPLKAYFTGQEKPPKKRVTTCQKCIRTGDIENVGKTSRHATFFEMLGNFSFGDYFKKEVIPWAWEFVTQVLEIPEERLYVSVYEEDDEAYDIWHKSVGLSAERIVRLGKEDNFWEIGVGPCGPCSEIYFDRGEEFGCGRPDCAPGCDCDRFVEIWNLVFTQFDKDEEGNYNPLPNPNIDTGAGLERVAAVMQGVTSIFDVDTVKHIRDKVCEIAKVKYQTDAKKDISIRVITDHIRAVTFMASDGIIPSNEGRGYVFRRLLRRAVRHGKLLGINKPFLEEIAVAVIETSKEAYPELVEKKEYILKVLSVEEERFNETIDQGLDILKDFIAELKKSNNKVLSGKDSFKLYDTYGFPIDLTMEILAEEGLSLDEEGFKKEMEIQRERARQAREETSYMGAEATIYTELNKEWKTKFVGYTDLTVSDVIIRAIIVDNQFVEKAEKGAEVSVIVDITPFYAESGGQVGDKGIIKSNNGLIEIYDCIKVTGDNFAHIGKVIEGTVSTGEKAVLEVDKENRLATARNHSATHLLHKALRELIGNHVEQAGSHVSPERLRFDFVHFSALSADEIMKVEEMVNKKILENLPIVIQETSIDEARKMGAMALFGEKYGKEVRVVTMGDFSMELCGGTHLMNTAQIGLFKIISETGVAAGVRRIEALTGQAALNYYRQQEALLHEAASLLKTNPNQISRRIKDLLNEIKENQKELEKLRAKTAGELVGDILSRKKDVEGIPLITARLDDLDMAALRNMGDNLKNKMGSGLIVLASGKDSKVSFVVMATEDLVKKGVHAGNLIREIAQIAGGSGGGRPNMAQAGGKDLSKIDEALNRTEEILKKQLN